MKGVGLVLLSLTWKMFRVKGWRIRWRKGREREREREWVM
jgi:hypothetical protein